ncbi:MAG: SDR family NAD(P)-dependent oxidoreductase [Clostridiales bacterium]|nr:SDR family NAD(P)-dependent oxidoreductase [Clostridiales bacterium]
MKNFAGKIAFITGGASGAGLGQAKVFGKAGMRVAIADIRQEALDKAVEELIAYGLKREDILPIQVDLTDRKAYAAAADKVEEVFGGPPHLLIQTAGVNSFGPAEASTFDDYDWVMGVCLHAVVNGLVIFVPRMVKAYGHKEEFHVAATSSMGGFMAGPITAPYSAAKAAVNILMFSYNEALRPYGGGATALCPGNIRSNIGEAEKYRPAHLRNTGYNVTEKTIGLLKNIHAHGMDPVELAEHLKAGIENNQPLVIPYPNPDKMLREQHEIIELYCTPEGVRKLEERRKEMEEKRKEVRYGLDYDEAGFAKARPDLDWVDPSKKVSK